MNSQDKVLICNLEYCCHIGFTDEERQTAQRILVDAEIQVDIRRAVRSDDVRDSVCWERLSQIFGKAIESRNWVLAETLAEQLSQLVFEHFPAADALALRVKKFCLPNAEWVGVEIARNRE